jgi:hypothetical protein
MIKVTAPVPANTARSANTRPRQRLIWGVKMRKLTYDVIGRSLYLQAGIDYAGEPYRIVQTEVRQSDTDELNGSGLNNSDNLEKEE